jgi:hypothetical protein
MTTATQNRSAQRTVTVSQTNGSRAMQQAAEVAQAAPTRQVTAEDVKAHVEARLQAALDQALSGPPAAQVAELQGWWDMYALGPIQVTRLGGPFPPNDVIRAGEPAFVVTILILNPNPILPPGISPGDILSKFALTYEVTYQTGNLTKWQQAGAPLTSEHDGLKLVPGQYFYVDVLEFTPRDKDEVMYEMNISARIFGCNESYAPPFAGFAREVYDIDPDMFSPAPGLGARPIRFLVYGNAPQEV